MTESVLTFSNIATGYGSKKILEDISLDVTKGEILTLAGPNGCGKSTLLKAAARQLPLMAGEIMLFGRKLDDFSQKELAKQAALLPQSRSIPGIPVEQLVLHGRFPYLGLSRRPGREDKEKVAEAMELAGVADMRHRDLRSLSGGERQKAYLAMVIAQDTDLIFLDEPTTYLDIGKQFEILELIRRLNREGKTIVMVLHDLAHALTYSHRIAVMEKGCLLAVQQPEELFKSGLLNDVFGVEGHWAAEEKTYYFTPHHK